MARIKIAVVGYGEMGGWHVNKLGSLNEFEIAGIYDILEDRRNAAATAGLKAYPTLEALLADKDIQLITIATPNDFHAPIAISAMEMGKGVISEKPVTLNSGLLEDMIAASKRNNVLFTVHQNRRWDEDFRIASKIVNDDILHNAFCAESRVQGSRGIPTDWRNIKEQGGGMVYDWGVHLFDQFLTMKAGHKVVSIYAELSYIINSECDDGLKVHFTFDDGFRALAEIGTSNFISLPRWYITGENGSAVIENWTLDGKIVMVSDWEKRDPVPVNPVITAAGITKTMAPRSPETIKEYPLPRVPSDVRDYYRNIKEVLEGKAEPIVTHDQQRRLMKVIEAIFKSSKTRQAVNDVI